MLALVVSNLLYPLIAVGVAALLCVVIVVRQRRPKSVEANMRAFNKGLRALAPEGNEAHVTSQRPARRSEQPAARSVVTTAPPPGISGGADPTDGVEAETG